METRIASYQEPGIRLQLLEIMHENDLLTTNINGEPMAYHRIEYQIRKNRKVLCTMKWETTARQKFNSLIQQQLLQTKLEL